MNLQDIWQDIPTERFEVQVIEEGQLGALDAQKSNSPLEKLRRQVAIKMGFIGFFILCFLGLMPFLNEITLFVLLLILTLAYVIGFVLLWEEYKYLKPAIAMDQSLLETLTTFRDRIKKILRYEEVTGLCLYPISGTLGFLFSISQKEPLATALQDVKIWITLTITLVVLTPLCHMLAKWMNRKAFGKYLDQLEENILSLQEEV